MASRPKKNLGRPSALLVEIMWENHSRNSDKDDRKVGQLFQVNWRTAGHIRRFEDVECKTIEEIVALIQDRARRYGGRSIEIWEAFEFPPLPDKESFYSGIWWSYFADHGNANNKKHSVWWEEQIDLCHKKHTDGVLRIAGRSYNARKEKYRLWLHRPEDGTVGMAAIGMDGTQKCFHAFFTRLVDDCLLGIWLGHNARRQPAVLPAVLSRQPINDPARLQQLLNDFVVHLTSAVGVANHIEPLKDPPFLARPIDFPPGDPFSSSSPLPQPLQPPKVEVTTFDPKKPAPAARRRRKHAE